MKLSKDRDLWLLSLVAVGLLAVFLVVVTWAAQGVPDHSATQAAYVTSALG